MPYLIGLGNTLIMEDQEEEINLSVVDVYDLASEIGKEFEKIIDACGSDTLTGLMPKVICALEYLEKLTTNHENSASYIQELKSVIMQLENDKMGKIEVRQKYEKELEEIEDRLKEESLELVAMVSRLQDENRKLSSSLAQSEGSSVLDSNGCGSEIDIKIVSKMKEMIESQREQLRLRDRELQDNQTVIEKLNFQCESFKQSNKDLRRRQKSNAGQMRCLIDERADLQAALQEEQRTITLLKQRLGLAEKENQDLSLSSVDSIDLSNKMVFDRDDPNRPRFTMTELKDILYERNELKARVSDLEDELAMFRPASASSARARSHIICPPLDVQGLEDKLSLTSLDNRPSIENEEDDASDLPVQGPMPYEPDDAPFKKTNSESGIRKFFSRVARRVVLVPEVKEGSLPT